MLRLRVGEVRAEAGRQARGPASSPLVTPSLAADRAFIATPFD